MFNCCLSCFLVQTKTTPAILINMTFLALCIPSLPSRTGNQHANRASAIEFVRSWDEEMFERQFRLCREDFNNILTQIAPLIERNEQMAIRSSGSNINPELRLLITLRVLAGARYLDMIHYRVDVDHVLPRSNEEYVRSR